MNQFRIHICEYSSNKDNLIPKRLRAILRTILFALIWLFSGGKHHLWIFPNLTEDVGPIESFMPLYTYKYTGTDFKVKFNFYVKQNFQRRVFF